MRELQQISAVLQVQWLVQPEAVHRCRMRHGIERTLAHHHFDRVTRHQANQAERDQRDPKQSGQQGGELAQQVGDHGG